MMCACVCVYYIYMYFTEHVKFVVQVSGRNVNDTTDICDDTYDHPRVRGVVKL